jgi:hypothetical protein
MNVDEHPALTADDDELPSLTFVLPEHLERDEVLQGLVMAITQVRFGLAARIQLFRDLENNCAARGDEPRRALCRGQALGGARAAAAIDEAIVEVFALWDQCDDQLLGLARDSDHPDATPRSSPGQERAARAGATQRCPSERR